MTRFGIVPVVAAALLLACAAPAEAAKRLALLVGNASYAEIPGLTTAVNDVRASKAALEKLGFAVELVENGTKRQISRALARTESAVEPGDTVVFHFAGHGIEIDGQNWLLPVDIPTATRGEAGLVKDESLNAAGIVERFRGRGARTVVAILDACRDNPFAAGGAGALGGTPGLARMDAPGGAFIILSAGAKQQALERLSEADPEKTSVFARIFLPLLGEGRMTLVDLARETQERVRALARTAGHEQIPAFSDGGVGRLMVTGEAAIETVQPKMQAPSTSSEDVFWRSAELRDDVGSYQAYLDEVGRGTFTGLYRRLAELRLAAKAAEVRGKTVAKPPEAAAVPPGGQMAAGGKVAAGQAEASNPDIEACDRAAAAVSDPERPRSVPGVEYKSINATAAIEACLRAVDVPGRPRRIGHQLWRAYDKLGLKKDAADWLRRAADEGHARSFGQLGQLYENGKGIRRDYAIAMDYYQKAAESGDADAYAAISILYQKGLGVKRDYNKALAYVEKSAAAGSRVATYNVGIFHLNGWGVPPDHAKACEYFVRSARLGYDEAVKQTRKRCRS